MDIGELLLRRGHRYSTAAEGFESTRSWRKAILKHQEAAECFSEWLRLSRNSTTNRAISLLILQHKKRCEEIRDQLAHQPIHNTNHESKMNEQIKPSVTQNHHGNDNVNMAAGSINGNVFMHNRKHNKKPRGGDRRER
eukprot:327233_1